MNPRDRHVFFFRLLLGVVWTVTLAGCAATFGGVLPGILLLIVSLCLSTLGLRDTLRADSKIVCDGTVETACVNGTLVDACCPRGAVCNFGRGLQFCDDGSCAVYPEECSPQAPTPTPTPMPSACVGDCDLSGGVTVEELIRGVSISLGSAAITDCDALDVDSDDRVTIAEIVRAVGNAMAGCEPPCNGTWGQQCLNGVATDACCPAGAVCNFERWTPCEDGSCVILPETCAETCDGHWETACQNGVPVRACCPAGLSCNFGLGLNLCDDGTCVYFPDTCS